MDVPTANLKRKVEKVPQSSYDAIVIGSGGGFTGAVSQYVIDKTGKIILTNSLKPNDSSLVRVLSEQELQHLYHQLDSIKARNITFSKPSNMYYFVGMTTNDSTQHRITWSDMQLPPAAIKQFYDNTMQLIRQTAEQ